MKTMKILSIIFIFVLFQFFYVYAQTSNFTYQGLLKDGANPANGSYDLSFTFYDAVSAGSQIGTIVYIDDKTITNGLLSIEINPGSAVFDGSERWVEIGIRSGSADNSIRTGYTNLTPRQKFTSAPYAIMSQNSAKLAGKDAGEFVETAGDTMTGALIINGSGTALLDANNSNASGSAVHGKSTGATAYGVYGEATGANAYAGYFSASGTGGRGLYAYSAGDNAFALEAFAEGTGTSVGGRFDTAGGTNSKAVEGIAGNDGSFENYGGHFTAAGSLGIGVLGKATGLWGCGVRGQGNGANGKGGYFSSTGASGIGLEAYSSGENAQALEAFAEGEGASIGGRFESAGKTGKAVIGVAGNDSGTINYGGHFTAAGSMGEAIYGKSTGANGYGVHGESTGVNGYGGYFAASGASGRGLNAYASGDNSWAVEAFAEGDGASIGGHFETAGATGKAVEGIAGNDAGTVNYGGYFRADGVSGTAVYGEATGATGIGLVTIHKSSGNYVHLAGQTNAGYFNGKVVVNSDVEAMGDYKYSSIKTYNKQFPSSAFAQSSPSETDTFTNTSNGYMYLSSGTSPYDVNLIAPVNLPDAAVVTEVFAFFYDNSADDMTYKIYLKRRGVTSTTVSNMATLLGNTTGASTNVEYVSTTSITNPTIDNTKGQYYIFISLQISSIDANVRFYGITIRYTLDTVTQ